MLVFNEASLILAGLTALAILVVFGGGPFAARVWAQPQPAVPAKRPKPSVEAAQRAKRSAAYRLGAIVLVGLGALTAVEFWVALTWPSVALLVLVELCKAALLMQYYMHLKRVSSEEED